MYIHKKKQDKMVSNKHYVALISAAFLTISSIYYYKRKKKQCEDAPKEICEVIFFSEKDSELRKSKYSRCMITVSMNRVLYFVSKSKETLDLCMYVFTNQDLTNALLKLNFKNVKIRIIVDAQMAYSTGSAIRRMEKQGIEVRWIKTSNYMHHKFCVIDGQGKEPIVMTGSLNWTTQALFGNYENVVVNSQSEFVDQFRNEFERLWVLFKPVV